MIVLVIFILDNNTITVFKKLTKSQSKNTVINKGNMIFNGDISFKNVNLENYSMIQSTYKLNNDATNESKYIFNYSKWCFSNTDQNMLCKITNVSKESSLRLAPTTNLSLNGYNVINYGNLVIGQKINQTDKTTINKNNIEEICFDAKDLSSNATLLFGFSSPNPTSSKIQFKNFSNIIISPKSTLVVGNNSTLNVSGKQQVLLINQGILYNYGMLQVNKNALIKNIPCPFSIINEEYSIINGGITSFGTNSLILIKKPIDSDPNTGGFIKSVSALLNSGGKIENNSNGVLVLLG